MIVFLGQVTGEPDAVVADSAQIVLDQLTAVAVAVLPFVAILCAIAVGWRFALRTLRFGGGGVSYDDWDRHRNTWDEDERDWQERIG